MTTLQMNDAQICGELRNLVAKERARFREDLRDSIALIEAQASTYSAEEKLRATKVIAEIRAKMDAADEMYDQMYTYLERCQ
ncbi:hypothetical protein [Aurantiacibacter sp. MUD61]|uniref:hypothetical protein n=1 Tax=Aurantiacibacter sp. MUD61 TaxID=3009083 RepID=UPI0022F07582|nr:hypothetical protein [Aurantiacibacter sp. MUD61]